MKKRLLFLLALVAVLALVLASCTLNMGRTANLTSTPTKTQRPLFTATLTPSATIRPTDTPLPTDTPFPSPTSIPPTETLPPPEDTALPTATLPLAETQPPTDTPLPPTDTPAPPTETPALPPNTAAPKPTDTPLPPTNTPKPKVDFRVADIVAFEDGSLTVSGLHNVYFTVLDAGGAPIDGIILEEVNNQPPAQVVTGNKGPGKTEFTMWAADYRFKVVGNSNGNTFSSETTHVLSILYEHAVWEDLIRGGICSDETACRAMGPLHFSYNVTFQRTW